MACTGMRLGTWVCGLLLMLAIAVISPPILFASINSFTLNSAYETCYR